MIIFQSQLDVKANVLEMIFRYQGRKYYLLNKIIYCKETQKSKLKTKNECRYLLIFPEILWFY